MTKTVSIIVNLDRSVEMDMNKREHLRLGQTYFNNLFSVEPEIADKIRGTEDDPFYDDKKVNAFKKKMIEYLVRKYG